MDEIIILILGICCNGDYHDFLYSPSYVTIPQAEQTWISIQTPCLTLLR